MINFLTTPGTALARSEGHMQVVISEVTFESVLCAGRYAESCTCTASFHLHGSSVGSFQRNLSLGETPGNRQCQLTSVTFNGLGSPVAYCTPVAYCNGVLTQHGPPCPGWMAEASGLKLLWGYGSRLDEDMMSGSSLHEGDLRLGQGMSWEAFELQGPQYMAPSSPAMHSPSAQGLAGEQLFGKW